MIAGQIYCVFPQLSYQCGTHFVVSLSNEWLPCHFSQQKHGCKSPSSVSPSLFSSIAKQCNRWHKHWSGSSPHWVSTRRLWPRLTPLWLTDSLCWRPNLSPSRETFWPSAATPSPWHSNSHTHIELVSGTSSVYMTLHSSPYCVFGFIYLLNQ